MWNISIDLSICFGTQNSLDARRIRLAWWQHLF